jgi:hypothetical protein
VGSCKAILFSEMMDFINVMDNDISQGPTHRVGGVVRLAPASQLRSEKASRASHRHVGLAQVALYNSAKLAGPANYTTPPHLHRPPTHK